MATSEQWTASRYDWSKTDTEAMDGHPLARCVMELRDRVEALETAANDRQSAAKSPPADGLVQRVVAAMSRAELSPTWEPEARAAIREVAAWLRERGLTAYALGAHLIEQEVDRG